MRNLFLVAVVALVAACKSESAEKRMRRCDVDSEGFSHCCSEAGADDCANLLLPVIPVDSDKDDPYYYETCRAEYCTAYRDDNCQGAVTGGDGC